MDFPDTNIPLPTVGYFLLAQKVTNPVSLREPKASSRIPIAPIAGQRGLRALFTGWCCALRLTN